MPATSTRPSPQQESEFYTWSFPGAPVQVNLSLKVVQDIRQCLAHASTSAAAPAFVEGVLLGNIVTPGLPTITGFRLLQTRTSAKAAELEEAMALVRNSGDNLIPIGYFRSHTGERLALSPEDISLAEAHFSDPNYVFLLIDASAPGTPNAGFFYWDRGKMNGGFYDFCFLEFPFDVLLLNPGGYSKIKEPEPQPELPLPDSPPVGPISLSKIAEFAPKPNPAEPPPFVADPAPAPPISANPPVAPPVRMQESAKDSPPKPGLFWRVARMALVALACFAAGIFLTQKLADLFTNTGHTPIALKVERQGTDLSVTWNHHSPVVSQAESGQVTIYDGSKREFPLDKSRIRSGSIVYSPLTAQVRVQLDIQTPDHQTVTESVMVILNRPELTESSSADEPANPAGSPSRPAVPVSSSAARDAPSSLPPRAAPASPKARATREFLAPREPAAAAQPQTSELAPPPPVTAVHSAPTSILAPSFALPRGQLPPAPKTANANPAVQPQAASPTSTRLADRLSPVPDYVPPVAIQQISPTRLTPAQRSFLSRPVVVEIKVFIDASGKVFKTEPLTHTSPVLITAARSAAILWKFQPARREGLSVASEIILRFKFDPAQ